MCLQMNRKAHMAGNFNYLYLQNRFMYDQSSLLNCILLGTARLTLTNLVRGGETAGVQSLGCSTHNSIVSMLPYMQTVVRNIVSIISVLSLFLYTVYSFVTADETKVTWVSQVESAMTPAGVTADRHRPTDLAALNAHPSIRLPRLCHRRLDGRIDMTHSISELAYDWSVEVSVYRRGRNQDATDGRTDGRTAGCRGGHSRIHRGGTVISYSVAQRRHLVDWVVVLCGTFAASSTCCPWLRAVTNNDTLQSTGSTVAGLCELDAPQFLGTSSKSSQSFAIDGFDRLLQCVPLK